MFGSLYLQDYSPSNVLIFIPLAGKLNTVMCRYLTECGVCVTTLLLIQEVMKPTIDYIQK